MRVSSYILTISISSGVRTSTFEQQAIQSDYVHELGPVIGMFTKGTVSVGFYGSTLVNEIGHGG